MEHSSRTSRPLSLVEKLRQGSVQDFVELSLSNGKSSGPLVVELDPTTACNLACHDCISANLLNQGGFEPERLLELAREFKDAGVKAVVLIGGGEPMAHPEFGNVLKYFSEVDIHTGVTSNGTLLNRYMTECTSTKWLRISVDAGSEEVFAQFRPHRSGRSQFNLVIDNMRRFAEIKTGLLGYSFLILNMRDSNGKVTATNAGDIARAARLAKEIGCDYFEVKPAFDLMHFLQRQEEDVVQIVNDQLAEAHSLASSDFSIVAPFTLEEALHGNSVQIKPYSRCLTAELRTVVSPSGTYVCPYHRGNLQMKIGDSNKSSLLEIWGSDKRNQVMENLDPRKHCTFHCIRHESNLLLEQMLSGDIVERVEDFDRFI